MNRNRYLAVLAAVALHGALGQAAVFGQSYSDAVLSDGPLLYWNFNEAGDSDAAIDLVGSDAGDNLNPEGNATRVPGTSTAGGVSLGRAASFDGTQFSKFYSGALSPPADPESWAIEMWVRPEGPDPGDRFDYLLEARGPGNNNRPAILFDYGNNDIVEVWGGGGRTGPDGPVLVTDVWQHVVIGYFGDAGGRIDFFLNGAFTGSAAYEGVVAFGTNVIAVGNSVPGSPDYDHFKGQIDELAIYDLTGLGIPAISAKLNTLAAHYSLVPEPAAGFMFCVGGLAWLWGRRGLRRRGSR